MKISHDGLTVRFKTEPEDLFNSEKSGAKPNTVRIIDHYERQQLKKKLPHKIIIQHGQEIFLRTVTHVYVSEMVLGKYIAIFSWTNLEHHHTMYNETGPDPKAHTMSLDEVAEPYIDEEISRELLVTLNNLRGKLPLNELIRKMIDCYLTAPHQHTRPASEDYNVAKSDLMNIRTGEFAKCATCRTLFHLDLEEKTAPSLTDDAFAAVTVSKNLLGLLQSIAHGRSMNSVIQELYEASQYQQFKMDEKGLDPKAHIMSPDEGEPPIDLDQTPILIPRSLLSDLNWHRGNDTLPEFISKLLKDRTGGQ